MRSSRHSSSAALCPALALLASSAWTAWAGDACECLNWQSVYESGRAICGEGVEFPLVDHYLNENGIEKTLEVAYKLSADLGFWWYHEVCSFFKLLPNNRCVNIDHHSYDDVGPKAAQWCFVSRECGELNGGAPVPDKQGFPWAPTPLSGLRGISQRVATWAFSWLVQPWARRLFDAKVVHRDVSVKICVAGKDALLSDMPVMDLLEMAARMDAVVGFATKSAYPTAKRHNETEPIWSQVEEAVAKGAMEELPDIVRRAIADKKPIIIDTDPAGHLDQRILVGREVYEIKQECGLVAGCGGEQWPFRRGRDMGEL